MGANVTGCPSVLSLSTVQGSLVLSLSPWTLVISSCSARDHTESAGRQMEQGTSLPRLALCLIVHLCRYVMYIRGHGETYMLDRDNAVFAVPQLSFPARKRPGDFVRDTLVDGVSRVCVYVSLIPRPLGTSCG